MRDETTMPALLHKCMTKATTAEGDQMRCGPNWLLSRRGRLKVFDDHLECGDWSVKYADICDAVLYSVRSSFFLPGYVLRVATPAKVYHFGLNWGAFWKADLPFPVRRERGRLSYSLFSIVIRLVLVIYVVHLLWGWLRR